MKFAKPIPSYIITDDQIGRVILTVRPGVRHKHLNKTRDPDDLDALLMKDCQNWDIHIFTYLEARAILSVQIGSKTEKQAVIHSAVDGVTIPSWDLLLHIESLLLISGARINGWPNSLTKLLRRVRDVEQQKPDYSINNNTIHLYFQERFALYKDVQTEYLVKIRDTWSVGSAWTIDRPFDAGSDWITIWDRER